MGLVAFGALRVGFWVVARGIPAAAELPAHIVPRTFGQPSDDSRALVVAAADGDGQVVWASVLHGNGAAILLEWQGALLVAMGPWAVRLDESGAPLSERLFETTLVAAWPVPAGLLLLGDGRLWLADAALKPAWSRPLSGELFHLRQADDRAVTLVAMQGDDWSELVLDVRTGATLAS